MAIHPDLTSLIRESLTEYLEVAQYCVKYRKDSAWPDAQQGGCLGYPAAVMLFSIVDTLGSFYHGRSDLNIMMDGKRVHIKKGGIQHYFILNSDYYGETLDGDTIKTLYSNFRNPLVHNASLAPSSFLRNLPDLHEAFPQRSGRLMVNVPAFLEISRGAVKRFLDRIDDVVPSSQKAENIHRKK